MKLLSTSGFIRCRDMSFLSIRGAWQWGTVLGYTVRVFSKTTSCLSMWLSRFQFPPAGNERLCFPTSGSVSCQRFGFGQFSWLCILCGSVLEQFCTWLFTTFSSHSASDSHPSLCLSVSVSPSPSFWRPHLSLSLHPAQTGLTLLLHPSEPKCHFCLRCQVTGVTVPGFCSVKFLHHLCGNNLITHFLTTELERLFCSFWIRVFYLTFLL